MPGQSAVDESAAAAAAAAAASEDKGLDQQLWQACAGSMVQLPTPGSKVIYFPQGHGEQAASLPDFPRGLGPAGVVPCRVLSVKFLADKETDEVYSRIRLQPEGAFGEVDENDPPSGATIDKPTAFAKTLTQSDANNGGGFSVPRYCAETIFPKLDYSADPPVQTVLAKDVHGETWKFRHIYRGTPRRHLLTTGWSTFVNKKKLVAGDAIVFLRTSSGELCVGVRRSMRGATSGDALLWHSGASVSPAVAPSSAGFTTRSSSRWEVRPETNNYNISEDAAFNGSSKSSSGGSFARNRSRVAAKSVLDAVTLAASGKAFEVIYYPRASTAEFCVKATTVKTALSHPWYAGMRFKMAFETEDSSRISWFMGTVSAVQAADPVLWPNSPWRVLQVAWDEPDLLQGVSRISPWQVELVSTVPMQLPPTPFSLPKKKFRVSTHEGHGFSSSGSTTLGGGAGVLGQMNSWHGLSDEVPASMQGARHERLYGLTFSDCQPSKLQAGALDKFLPQEHAAAAAMLSFGAQDLRLGNVLLYGNGNDTTNRNVPTMVTTATTPGRSSQNGSVASVNTTSTQPQVPAAKQAGTILLFGKTINTASNVQDHQQNSGGSSSEGNNNSGSTTTTTTTTTRALSGTSSGGGDGADNGSLKWLKEQASVLSSERKDTLEDGTSGATGGDVQCKIFLESEEVGRTLDLSQFASYEELYTQLSKMFGIEDDLKLSGRVVYKDSEGSTIHVGGEPYMNFVRSVKRLTILADTRMLQ